MKLNQAINIINKRLTKKQPKTFTGIWIKRNAPRVHKFIKQKVKNELGETDWDKIISHLDRTFQKRWYGELGKRRKKKVKKYNSKKEVNIILKKYQKRMFIFIQLEKPSDYQLCDKICISLVRNAQRGNELAKEELLKWVKYIIGNWLEHSHRLTRWNGYSTELQEQLHACIRRFRYAGTFLGYLFRTLEYSGQGLRPLYVYSLDDTIYDGKYRKVDVVIKDPETNVITFAK
jgi:hypothetical protein